MSMCSRTKKEKQECLATVRLLFCLIDTCVLHPKLNPNPEVVGHRSPSVIADRRVEP